MAAALTFAALRALGGGAAEAGTPARLASVALGWLLAASVGAIPFLWMARMDALGADASNLARWPNAVFESFSAFTSTGLTMSAAPSALPPSIQLYRSLAQWAGGLGMTVFVLMVVHPDETAFAMLKQEVSAPLVKDAPGTTARRIVALYVGATLLSMALFLVTGMPAWEAINHGLTGIATGGMTITDDSFQSYSNAVKVAAIGVMILGGLSFVSYHMLLFARNLRALRRRSELRLYLATLLVGVLLVALLSAWLSGRATPVDAAFSAVSSVTTCGFSASSIPHAPLAVLLLLGAGMLVGAESGSTAGALKMKRVVWLLKGIVGRVSWEMSSGERAPRYELDGERVTGDEAAREIQSAGVVAGLWLITIGVAVFCGRLLSGTESALGSILFDVTSALGGVGLSAGWVGAELSTGAKLMLSLLMWLGRLEILAAVSLVLLPIRSWIVRRRTESGRAHEPGRASG